MVEARADGCRRSGRAVDALIEERDPYCRGVLLLGLAANADTLAPDSRSAREPDLPRLRGRPHDLPRARRKWLAGDIDDAALVREVRANFEALIRAWHVARGTRGVSEAANGIEEAAA